MKLRRVIAGFVAAGASASAQAALPGTADVQHALAETCPKIGKVANVRCADFAKDGEPTEAVCSYKALNASKMIRDKTYFAVDSTGWHLTDTPAYCPGQK